MYTLQKDIKDEGRCSYKLLKVEGIKSVHAYINTCSNNFASMIVFHTLHMENVFLWIIIFGSSYFVETMVLFILNIMHHFIA